VDFVKCPELIEELVTPVVDQMLGQSKPVKMERLKLLYLKWCVAANEGQLGLETQIESWKPDAFHKAKDAVREHGQSNEETEAKALWRVLDLQTLGLTVPDDSNK
jgi:hypothetical protein